MTTLDSIDLSASPLDEYDSSVVDRVSATT